MNPDTPRRTLDERPATRPRRDRTGTRGCSDCGKTISANKDLCWDCASGQTASAPK